MRVGATVLAVLILGGATAAQSQTISDVVGGDIGDGGLATMAGLGSPTGITTDAEGNMYVADASHYRVRRVDALTGIITTVAGNGLQGSDGDGGPAIAARLQGPRGLEVVGNLLYIADSSWRIRRVDLTSGTISTVLGDNGTLVANYRDIAVGPDGDLYIADEGDQSTGGYVLRWNPDNGAVSYLAGTGVRGFSGDDGPSSSAQVDGPRSIAVDESGNVFFSDFGNVRIRRIDAFDGTISTVAGDGTYSLEGEGAPARFVPLFGPEGIDIDANGNIYIAGNTVVHKIDAASGLLIRLAGEGSNGNTPDEETALLARLDGAGAITVAADGTILVAVERNYNVRRIDPALGTITTAVGVGVGDGDDTEQATLLAPGTLSLGPDGDIYIADARHNRVRRLDPSDGVIETFAGTGGLSFNGDGGLATDSFMGNPMGVAAGPDGTVYIADTWTNRIRRVDAVTGRISTFAGNSPAFQTGSSTYNGDDIVATSAALSEPSDAAVWNNGLYIADTGNHRIRRVDLTTRVITTVAGNGTALSFGDGGPATSASIKSPSGVFVDTDGTIYIADTGGHRIRKVDTSGIISTIAGLGVGGYTGDGGDAQGARLQDPADVAVDGTGTVYIADAGNHVVRAIATDGTISTVAGNGTEGYAGIGGAPTQAQLGTPSGVLVDAAGNLYISDRTNHALLVISTDNTPPTIDVVNVHNAVEGQAVQFTATAADEDGDAVELAVRNAPFGSSFANGIFAWTPDYNQQGSYQVSVTAVDERGGSSSSTVNIEVADVLSLSATSLDVGTVLVDGTASSSLSLRNDGPADIEVDISTNRTDFVATPSTAHVAAGGQVDLDIQFTPNSSGAKTASLLLTVGSRLTALSADLQGEGQSPSVSVSPERLDFGQVASGASSSKVLTVTNSGEGVLTISNTVPGSPNYSVSTPSFSLNTGSSRDITITYNATGQASSTDLTLLTSDSTFPSITVPMSALSSSDTPPSLSVLPSVLNFGSVGLGQTKSLALLVSNAGGGTLRLLNIISSSADVTVSQTILSLTGGQEALLTLTLQPTRLGSFAQTLDIPSNDPTQPFLQVPLRATVVSGTGQPTLELPTTVLDFGQVAEGATSRFSVLVRNSGTAPLIVANVVSDNTQVVSSPTSLTVPPQETRSLTVSFRPLPGRERSGSVTLFTDDPVQPQVALTWSALDVATPFLQLQSSAPDEGAFGVSTNTTVRLQFDEPLFHRRGYTAIDAELRPQPLSGPLMQSLEVRGDGSIIEFPVELDVDETYRLVVFGATGWTGLELFDVFETTFSTGSAPPAFADLSGTVRAAEAGGIEGSVFLYEGNAQLAAQTPVSLDGTFAMTDVPAGQYRIYLDASLEDGRSLTGAYDDNGDGVADLFSLSEGESRSDLDITARTSEVTDPGDSGQQILLDLDPASGNQGTVTRWATAAGDTVHLDVFLSGVTDLTAASAEVTFDTTAVAFIGVSEGENILRQNGGTALFLFDLDPLAGTVELGGSIMGATESTAVSGSGLLGRYAFLVLDGFDSTDLSVTGGRLKYLEGRVPIEDTISSTLRSDAGPATSATPITLDLNPAAGDQGQLRAGGGAVGEHATIQLYVNGAPEVSGWSATIEFDPSVVDFADGSFAPGSFISGLVPLVDARSERVSVGGVVLGGSSTASGDGYLGSFDVEFQSGFDGLAELRMTQISLNTVASGEQIHAVSVVVQLTDEASSGIPADYNGDGTVDFSDFFIFADAFGSQSSTHDLTGDGQVDFSDFFVFADFFGTDGRAKLLAMAQELIGLPSQTALMEAYPNPFNAEVTLPYMLDRDATVTVDLFDMTGQRVRRLVSAAQPAGLRHVRWDGTDDRGRAAASGVYLVRLSTPETATAKKVLLLR